MGILQRIESGPSFDEARRILVVVQGYPPRQSNGAELQTHRKALWWSAHGYRVRVVAADPVSQAGTTTGAVHQTREQVDGIDVVRLTFAATGHRRPLVETFRHPVLESLLEREIIDFQPDLIYQTSGYIFGTLPARLGRRFGIPAVLFATDFWHICPRITLLRPSGTCCPGPRRPAECAACRIADRRLVQRSGPRVNELVWHVAERVGHQLWKRGRIDPFAVGEIDARIDVIREDLPQFSLVISNSRFLADQLERAGVPRERILVMRQGINSEDFTDAKSQRGQSNSAIRLFYMGQISRHKGIDLVIDAVERLADCGNDIQLAVHGPLTDMDRTFQHTITGRKFGATVIGPSLPHTEIIQELLRHDAFVVSVALV